jgi:site-specific DNA recombinase
VVTPGAKRNAVAHARECHGLSERRACDLIGIARRVARYQPSRADDAGLRQRLRELAAERRRFGYRRLGYLLVREGGDGPETLWQHRRAVSLLSGKVVCGVCGGSYATNGKDYMGCKAAERQGTCTNKVRIRRSRVEAEVLEALGTRLMEPDAVATFVAEFTAEWNRLSAESGDRVSLRRRELDQVERQLNGLIDAIADGLRAPGLQDRLDALGARREALRGELAALEARQSAPRLHPNLSEVYRSRVARLREGIEAQGDREVPEAARTLIARVEVHPPREAGDRPRLELLGELSALLAAAGVEGVGGNAKSPPTIAGGLDVFSGSVLGDAGTRNRRRHYINVSL